MRLSLITHSLALCAAAGFVLVGAAGPAVATGTGGASGASGAAAAEGANKSAAGSGAGVGISPADERAYFHVNLLSGQTSLRKAAVTNFSAQPVDLLIYSADGAVTAQGGFALGVRGAGRKVGAWVRLPIARLHLAGLATKVVAFPLTVPAGTPPGDYAGGILVQKVDAGKASAVRNGISVQLNIIQRIGVRIYLHVAGRARAHLQVSPLTWRRTNHGIVFSIPVTNTGNVLLKPAVRVHLSGFHLSGAVITMNRVEDLLPGSSVTFTGELPKPPLYGYGRAIATVTGGGDADGDPVSTSIQLIPVLPILVILGIVTALVLLSWRVGRFLLRARAALRQADLARQPVEVA